MKILPAKEELEAIFSYEPATGILRWRRNDSNPLYWNTKYAGMEAGYINKGGHVAVSMKKKMYPAHRIIWKMMTGRDPPNDIDHIDNVHHNNKWGNLREATRQQNLMNAGLHKGKTLPKGVSAKKGKYRACIRVNAKQLHLGTFETPAAAHAAYRAAAVKHFGEFARFS